MPTTFADIEALENGAEFLNADLHVHSFGASHDVKDSTMSVEAVVEEAVKMDIQILAITDHNTDANTEKGIKYAEKYSGRILVIPGVEVTTAHGHLLVYFPPLKLANVRNLLAKINIVGELGDENSHTTMSMADVIREADRLGGICIAAHIDRVKTGFETLAPGYPNWKRDILLSPGLYGVEIDSAPNLPWYSEEDDATGAGPERTKLLRMRGEVPEIMGRPALAHVQGSDAHSLKAFVTGRSGKILTRCKVNELTFDAFKTALSDSEARVRAVATIPRSFPRILGMRISGGFLDGETYRFSDNLNCFIGGRGTGKSSALRTLAHGLGIDNDFDTRENCPGAVVIYCEDANGMRFRYERIRGSRPTVRAKGEGEIGDVPVDAFRVEYYRQGELAEVSKDPLKNPILFQQFLDRHLILSDLLGKETQAIAALEQNSAQLIPLEVSAKELNPKKLALAEMNAKLAIAEAGKLKDIAAEQGCLANERNLGLSIAEIRDEYKLGLTLANFVRDYSALEAAVAPLTKAPGSDAALAKMKGAIDRVNGFLNEKEMEIKQQLSVAAGEITDALVELRQAQSQLEAQLNVKVKALQDKGLSGNIVELQTLLKQKSAATLEINRISGQGSQLKKLRADRKQYLEGLADMRTEVMARRKSQLDSINKNLATTIEDYTVFIRYEQSGVIEEFKDFILEKMQGTFFREESADHFCSSITPPELAEFVLSQDFDGISNATGLNKDWAVEICRQLRFWKALHALEVMWKPPCPVISVKTKGSKSKNIPINQLSDGQKHTIMLTIAMLAESNIPLVIDQPEDDLDNAFIFAAVVRVLRAIKERRQVILVTHNANIAVLGDAELLLPMRRKGDGGSAFDIGSIDRAETKKAALSILEGGEVAFRRRRVIYGH